MEERSARGPATALVTAGGVWGGEGAKARPQWLKSHEAARQYHIQTLVEEMSGAMEPC